MRRCEDEDHPRRSQPSSLGKRCRDDESSPFNQGRNSLGQNACDIPCIDEDDNNSIVSHNNINGNNNIHNNNNSSDEDELDEAMHAFVRRPFQRNSSSARKVCLFLMSQEMITNTNWRPLSQRGMKASQCRSLSLRTEDVLGSARSAPLSLKGLSQHVHYFRYRVQLRKPDGDKLSVNGRNVVEAFWICELGLLRIDCPDALSEQLYAGNFHALALLDVRRDSPFFFFANELEYFLQLGYWVYRAIADREFSEKMQKIDTDELLQNFNNMRFEFVAQSQEEREPIEEEKVTENVVYNHHSDLSDNQQINEIGTKKKPEREREQRLSLPLMLPRDDYQALCDAIRQEQRLAENGLCALELFRHARAGDYFSFLGTAVASALDELPATLNTTLFEKLLH